MSSQRQKLLRDCICQKVAELPLDCTVDQARVELELLLQQALAEAEEEEEEEEHSCHGTISPLMVASDKGNVACLEYFAQQQQQQQQQGKESSSSRQLLLLECIGKPLDRASDSTGGNSAVHHAASSGCVAALRLWHAMEEEDCSYYFKLGSITNAHGDTPLQMAATAGRLDFIQHWYALAVEEAVNNRTNDTEDDDSRRAKIRGIVERTNDSGDTCLSLACCHGQLDVLRFLLQEINPTMSHEEITKCQQACRRICDSVAECSVPDPDALKAIQKRKDRMCQGLELVQKAYEHQVERAAQELMAASSSSETPAQSGVIQPQPQSNSNRKSKKNNRKKKGRGARVPTGRSSSWNNGDTSPSNTDISATNDKLKDTVRVTTLSDGKLAVSVPGQALEENAITNTAASGPFMANHHHHDSYQPSVSDMFRQRWLNVAATAPPTTDHLYSEIDAMMDALCLDVSMLLYTPHGMALNLSPSQLEAVQHILQKQLSAVQEAREIQNRKHQQQQNARTNQE